MGSNRFTSIRALLLGLSVFMPCLLVACTFQQAADTPSPAADAVQPFEIAVTEVKIIRERQQALQNGNPVQTGRYENRLRVFVSISNVTNLELKDVWYELQLNSEWNPISPAKF